MDNCPYFRVWYRGREKENGIVVRINERGALEAFSGDNDYMEKLNLKSIRGNLVYESRKCFAQRITQIEAEKHRDGYEEWKGLQAFTSGASPAGIYSATPNDIRSKLGAF